MKGETQALHLEKIMQKHRLYPEYELALSPIQVKKNSIKRLSKGDILLLGLDSLNMILLDEGEICASVVINKIENSSKLRITQLNRSTIEQSDSKKYDTVKISFGMIQSRKLEVGHNIGTTSLNLQEVTLTLEDKNLAKGSLVSVDEEIAVQIDEVRR
jgi:flagellar motor switch/type III secretory pathway protein FliN